MGAVTFRPQVALVQDAIGTALATALPADVPSSVGYPAGGVQDRHVWVDGAFGARFPRYVSGNRARAEESQVKVRILVAWTTSDYADARDEALTLAGCVEDAIAADATLGGVVDYAKVTGYDGSEAIPDKDTREVGITVLVDYYVGNANAAAG